LAARLGVFSSPSFSLGARRRFGAVAFSSWTQGGALARPLSSPSRREGERTGVEAACEPFLPVAHVTANQTTQ